MSGSVQSLAGGEVHDSLMDGLLEQFKRMSDKQMSLFRSRIDAELPVDDSAGFTNIEDIPCEIPVVPSKKVSAVPSTAAPTTMFQSSSFSAPADGPPTKRAKRTFDDYQGVKHTPSIFGGDAMPVTQETKKAANQLRQPFVRPSSKTGDDDLPVLPSSSQANSGDEAASSSQAGSQWGSDSSQTVPSSPPPSRLSTRSKPSAAGTASQSSASSSASAVEPVRGLQASRYASSPAPSLASSPPPSPSPSNQQTSSTSSALGAAIAPMDLPRKTYQPITRPQLRSNMKNFSCGDHKGAPFLEMMHQLCATRDDYLRFLYHYGTIQLGHERQDYDAMNIVADYEAGSVAKGGVGLGRDGARIFPPESFVVCYGKAHRGTPMHLLPPDYIRHQRTTLPTTPRPWFKEASDIWMAQNEPPPVQQRTQSYSNFQQSISDRPRNNRGWNPRPRQALLYQPRYGGPSSSNHSLGANSSPANSRDTFSEGWRTVHGATEELTDVNPDRRQLLLEAGQPRLPSAYTVSKRVSSSTPATAECMDLTM
ncbi:uncharacterized protein J4E84_006790 [Alternaria hordeiaustralica]|uniref:uncharacterized protein n=1 Tax=Alternaria hordeiaustralica TaxID=1187925 RepID=UPI0020C36719|nr:uncharacterized protein J4E84_006790 [Alternaria hordeiaustralica]KAI4683950.1 hypothetical protein J4E84_006790 [Alternaria hordeiaustralica]